MNRPFYPAEYFGFGREKTRSRNLVRPGFSRKAAAKHETKNPKVLSSPSSFLLKLGAKSILDPALRSVRAWPMARTKREMNHTGTRKKDLAVLFLYRARLHMRPIWLPWRLTRDRSAAIIILPFFDVLAVVDLTKATWSKKRFENVEKIG